jgi:hypothetical protein
MEGDDGMRKTIMEYLLKRYLRTFPPIAKYGNGAFGEFRRMMLMIPINIVGGRQTEEMIRDITKRWLLTT